MSQTQAVYGNYCYPQRHALDRQQQALQTAQQLYERVSYRSLTSQIWEAVTKRMGHLQSLKTAQPLASSHYVGKQMVPLSQIRGSSNQGRSRDFDAAFRPLNQHNKERWLSVAKAHLLGVKLPPVSLIQVGNNYFVQDGHHRISVAMALGNDEIEAEVVMGQITAASSWQTMPTRSATMTI